MEPARYMAVTIVQVGTTIEAQARLTDQHRDGSREEVVYPLRLDALTDCEDLEDWTRQALAAAIELI